MSFEFSPIILSWSTSRLNALQEHRDRKKARVAPPSAYRSVKHVYSTTNIVERLFSRAKIVLSDLRNRITPRHLEDVLYLRVNRHLWNQGTIQAIMDRPQPAPVVVEVEMQERGQLSILVIIAQLIAIISN
jgi:hypothetical protein